MRLLAGVIAVLLNYVIRPQYANMPWTFCGSVVFGVGIDLPLKS
jgi:hypothetical protein